MVVKLMAQCYLHLPEFAVAYINSHPMEMGEGEALPVKVYFWEL